MKVWDAIVRLSHGSLLAGVGAAWITSERWTAWHEPVGRAVLAVVALRVVWGFVGSPYARFAQFVRSPAHTARYTARLLHRREPRYLGHNPLGGWMVMALLATVALAGCSGWLYTTDAFWGDARVENVHNALAILLLVLVGLHVTGAIVTSARHRENLVAAMVHGRKRPPADDDIA